MTAKIPAFTDIGKTARGEDLLPAGSMRQQIRLVPKGRYAGSEAT